MRTRLLRLVDALRHFPNQAVTLFEMLLGKKKGTQLVLWTISLLKRAASPFSYRCKKRKQRACHADKSLINYLQVNEQESRDRWRPRSCNTNSKRNGPSSRRKRKPP